VVGDGRELRAYTSERVAMQGVDSAWWVSRDGGSTWAYVDAGSGDPSLEGDEQACSPVACYRLVDGVRIERQAPAGGGAWKQEHERPGEDAPPPAGAYRQDWVEERSIAAASGPGYDVAVVAAGHDGVLVRDADGEWHAATVGHSWDYALRWWVAGLGSLALAACGATVLVVWFLIDWAQRRTGAAFRHLPPPPFSS
jgi:hypothetical protein